MMQFRYEVEGTTVKTGQQIQWYYTSIQTRHRTTMEDVKVDDEQQGQVVELIRRLEEIAKVMVVPCG